MSLFDLFYRTYKLFPVSVRVFMRDVYFACKYGSSDMLIKPVPYSVDPGLVSTISRYNQMIRLVGDCQRVLNLGDGFDSLLTKSLMALGCSVTTLDSHYDCNLKYDLENGLPRDMFMNATFDFVVAGELFEHIYHLKELLLDIKHVLTTDGTLVLSVPNVCNLRSRVRVLLGKLPSYAADGDLFECDCHYHGHVRDFNLTRIKLYLREAGFRVTDVTNNGLYYHWKPLLPSYLIPNTMGDNLIIKAVKE